MANSVLLRLRCDGPSDELSILSALTDPQAELAARVYGWKLRRDSERSMLLDASFRVALPATFFGLISRLPNTRWSGGLRLEGVLSDWYHLGTDDTGTADPKALAQFARVFPLLATHPRFGGITGREVVKMKIDLAAGVMRTSLALGERLGLRVERTFAVSDLIGGTEFLELFQDPGEDRDRAARSLSAVDAVLATRQTPADRLE